MMTRRSRRRVCTGYTTSKQSGPALGKNSSDMARHSSATLLVAGQGQTDYEYSS